MFQKNDLERLPNPCFLDIPSLTMYLDLDYLQNRNLDWKNVRYLLFAAIEEYKFSFDYFKIHDLSDGSQIGEYVKHASAEYKLPPEVLDTISNIWHENRHLLDLLLTNFGAFSIRRYFEFYINMRPIFASLIREKEKLFLFPFFAGLDEVRRLSRNVDKYPAAIEDWVISDARRRDWLNTDRAQINSEIGEFELGGKAQMESLATGFQLFAIQMYFGNEVLENIFYDHKARRSLSFFKASFQKYKWTIYLAERLGMLKSKEFKGGKIIDFGSISPILLASLCGRYQVREGKISLPSKRIEKLLIKISEECQEWRKYSTDDLWKTINKFTKTLWDKTILQELEDDWKNHKEWTERVSNHLEDHPSDLDHSVITAMYDWLHVRRELIELIRKEYVDFLEPYSYCRNLLPRISARPILIKPSGDFCESFSAYKIITKGSEVLDEWCWVITESEWPPKRAKNFIGLKSDSWLEFAVGFGAFAKIMLDGGRTSHLMPLELGHIDQTLRQFGVEFRYDPEFFPEFGEINNEDAWVYLNREENSCHFCRRTISKGNGHAIHPLAFRLDTQKKQLVIELLGGSNKGWTRFNRNWSFWFICEDCCYLINAGPDSWLLLYFRLRYILFSVLLLFDSVINPVN